ncbi:MAG TPA: glycosyltransferase [Acidimicrobiales bacterium]|nr:glycosyltransferase [Acidimicrobiales bacterium]
MTPRRPMRVAFQLFGGEGWLGGFHYLATLLSALHEHAGDEVEAVLPTQAGVAPELVRRLRPHLTADPVAVPAGGPGTAVGELARQRAGRVESVCRREGIDVVFQHAEWLGSRFGLPTLAWLGDFQHRVLPEMFGRRLAWRREARFQAVLRSATLLYVLSETDKRLGDGFYPRAAAKLRALPFAVGLGDETIACDPVATRDRLGLPERFFLLPGQMWRHKNHLAVVEAVARLKDEGTMITVASCGNPVDPRDPGHALRVRSRIAELGVSREFRLLGLLPRPEVWALARASAAVVNPSRYEGWSTPVEEAKSIGAPLLLSDLAVHREQHPDVATFFDPSDPARVAAGLLHGWRSYDPGPRPDAERHAAASLEPRRRAFAHQFAALVREAAAAVEGEIGGEATAFRRRV